MPEQHYKRTHPLCRVPIIHPAIVFEDCEGTFIWDPSGDGTDYTAEHDPSAAFVQTNGILLKTKATTPAVNDTVRLVRIFWLPPQMLVRLQLLFAWPSSAISCSLRAWLNWYDGAVQFAAGYSANPQSGEVSTVTGFAGVEPTWTILPDITVPLIAKSWNKLDFSVNWQTQLHHLLHFDNIALDTSAIPITQQPGLGPSFMSLHIELETLQLAVAEAWLDQILLTSENP